MDIPATPAYLPADNGSATLRLTQVVKVLKRYALLIVICTIGAAVGAFFYASSVPRTYTASSTFTVEGDQFAIPELQGALRNDNAPDPMPWVRTEVQALTSRNLVEASIHKIGLQADPEFNPGLRAPTFMETAKAAIKALLPVSSRPGAAEGPDEAVYRAVDRSLTTFQDNRSLVIATAFTAQDPQVAANFVNTLVSQYIASRADRRTAANRGANDTINERVKEAKAELDSIESQMRDMRSRGDIVALRAGSVGQQQVEELATAAAKASVDRAQLEANWNRAVSQGKQGSHEALAGVLDSPTISRLRDQESVASAKVAELSSRYGSSYPGLRSATADLQAVRFQLSGEVSRIVSSLGAQLRVARDKEADLQRQLAVARTAGVQGENARAQLDQLQQEAVTRRTLYQTLLQRAQQTTAQPAAAVIPDVRVLSTAVAPGTPSGPNTAMIVGLGGLSGLALSCMLALTRISTVNGFTSATEVTDVAGLPVLTTMRRSLLQPGLMARASAKSAGPEGAALRALRTSLRYAGRSVAPRCVLFASALSRGKGGELAAALARHAALEGEQVLLIEANLSTPTLAQLFGVRGEGLGEVLSGEDDWRDAVIPDGSSPLDLLVLRRTPANAHALLTGIAMQNLLVETRQEYDLVVLSGPRSDAPEILPLAMRADATILLVDAQAGRPAAQQAASQLAAQSRGTLAAVLVN